MTSVPSATLAHSVRAIYSMPTRSSNAFRRSCMLAGGLVQVTQFAVLPSPSPAITLLLVLLALLPCLFSLWQNPRPESFLPAAVYVCLCSFVFGYHVHVKAILMVTIPMALTAADSRQRARNYFMMSTVGHVALMPLLYTEPEYPIKVNSSLSCHHCRFCSSFCMVYCANVHRYQAGFCALLEALCCQTELQLY